VESPSPQKIELPGPMAHKELHLAKMLTMNSNDHDDSANAKEEFHEIKNIFHLLHSENQNTNLKLLQR
jgi:hypothetical protein